MRRVDKVNLSLSFDNWESVTLTWKEHWTPSSQSEAQAVTLQLTND